jgi:hypothetical protein
VVFFGLVFYCQPCLLLLQLHRVEDAEENLGNWKEKKNARHHVKNDIFRFKKIKKIGKSICHTSSFLRISKVSIDKLA